MARRAAPIAAGVCLALALGGACSDESSGTVSAGCAASAHNWKAGSADALTENGQATKERAEALASKLSDSGARVEARDANVYVGAGPNPRVEEGRIYTVVIPVPDASECPSAPWFRDDVPLTYEVK